MCIYTCTDLFHLFSYLAIKWSALVHIDINVLSSEKLSSVFPAAIKDWWQCLALVLVKPDRTEDNDRCLDSVSM